MVTWKTLLVPLKRNGGEKRNPKELASNVLTIAKNLNEYEDIDTNVELLAKIISNALEDAAEETKASN